MCCAELCLYAGSAGPNSLADVREASPQLTLTRLTRHCFDDAVQRRFSLCGNESSQQLGFAGSSASNFGGTLSALSADGSGQSWSSWSRANPRRHRKSVAPSSPELRENLWVSRSAVEQRHSGRRESSGWPQGTWQAVRGRSFQSAAVLHEGTHGRPPDRSDTHALGAVDHDEAVNCVSGGRRRTLFLSTKTGPLEDGWVRLERFQREVAAIPGTPPLRRDDTADIVTLVAMVVKLQTGIDEVGRQRQQRLRQEFAPSTVEQFVQL